MLAAGEMKKRQERPPTDRELAATLGVAAPLWRRCIRQIHASHGPLVDNWSASKAFGWTLRLEQPARVLVYLTPRQSHFLASFALGEKARAAARQAGIPASILTVIDTAPKYAEGRGVRIPVRTKADLEGVLVIAAVKISTTARVPVGRAASRSKADASGADR